MMRILTTIRDGLVDGFQWIANNKHGLEVLAGISVLLAYLVLS